MNLNIIALILGMAVVTYIPRALPVLFKEKMNFGERTEKFLRLIPYTAMTAMIFPGVIKIDQGKPYIGFLGGLVALVLAWRKVPVMICVVMAIVVDFGLYSLI